MAKAVSGCRNIRWWIMREAQVLASVDLPVIAEKYREFLKEQNG